MGYREEKIGWKTVQNQTELWTATQGTWNPIRMETFIALVDSMLGRLNEVKKAIRRPTKY